MDAAQRRLPAEDEDFLQLDGQLEGSSGGGEQGGSPLGRVGLGRGFRLVRWTADGQCLEACNAGYREVGVCWVLWKGVVACSSLSLCV
jgi:hypothetical protein